MKAAVIMYSNVRFEKIIKIIILLLTTVEPRLSGLFDYPNFFSGTVFFMNINRL